MRGPVAVVGVGLLVALAACGGGGSAAPGEPLVAGELSGTYKGIPFTPAFGFATVYQDTPLIGVGDGPLNCASPNLPDPPAGINAVFTVPTFEAGTYSSRLVQIYYNVGNFEGTGTNTGTVVITAVSTDSIAGSISYSYVDGDGETYGLNGTFEVMRCPG